MRKSFKVGQVIFEQGAASGDVFRVLEGTIEIIRRVGAGQQILLGMVRPGGFVGEMDVIRSRQRNATAQAATAVRVEVMSRNTFLTHVSRETDVAQKLILRLSSRLRDGDDQLIEALGGKTAMPAGGTPAKPPQPAKLPNIEIAASSAFLEERIGADPIRAEILPFRIGRPVDDDERSSIIPPDLAIEDPEPHRLSRSHFELFTEDGKICVRDLYSTLGTSVNGRPIGKNFAADVAALEIGRNLVAAGGRGTPYEFTVKIS
jgi:CRP-like cAMP-binding protein